MTLTAGARLGPYEILAPLGAGGMGEVYRARDTRLDRTVAIKVLPSHLSASPESRQRFEREAKTISQLSHPHICALHDVGREGETEYLVMEYLEGDTLADRLSKGALPLEQTLRFGIQIAQALDKAHRQGIVHRDLKPGNVMLTKSGVKLLDFGLAKALALPAAGVDSTALPTQAAPVTREGTLLGTVQYMAPEQVEGKVADARTDIFAFGCVLYEMATGGKVFAGGTQASLISAILRDEPPPISKIQPTTPAAFDHVVRKCLAKDPEDRWQSAHDVATELEWIREESTAAVAREPRPVTRRRLALLPWAIAVLAVAVSAVVLLTGRRTEGQPEVMRSYLPPPPNTTYHVVGANVGGIALSPDGRRIAFSTREPDEVRLWYRDLEAPDAHPIPGGEGALFPFWSPDSRSIAFFAKGRLKIVEASPSPPVPRDLVSVPEPRGGSWGQDGTILYGPNNFSPLMRVVAGGGTPAAATRLDRGSGEVSHRWPRFLPDGRRFLYLIHKRDLSESAVVVGSLDGADERQEVLRENTEAAYALPGHLFFRRGHRLMAVAADPRSLKTRGEPVELAPSIEGFPPTGSSVFAVSENLLGYVPRSSATPARIVWFDRSGKELSSVVPPGYYPNFTLSPDGRRVVVAFNQEGSYPDLWAYEASGRGIRMTHDPGVQLMPVFTPDGSRVIFAAYDTGPFDLWEIGVEGGGQRRAVVKSTTNKSPNDVSPDGRFLLYREFNDATRGDLMVVPLSGEGAPRPFLATPYEETNGDFSPDGRWVAYSSDESGRKEVYVASFPDPARRRRVSAEGGSQPRWSSDGAELFFLASGTLTSVAVSRSGDDLSFGQFRPLFRPDLFTRDDPGYDLVTRYDVAPDGRFLFLVRAGVEAPPPVALVFNWTGLLKK